MMSRRFVDRTPDRRDVTNENRGANQQRVRAQKPPAELHVAHEPPFVDQ